VLSRLPLSETGTQSWCARTDCRHAIAGLPGGIELHNLYIPAGGDTPDPAVNAKFAHKLQFLDEVAAWFAEQRQAARPMVLVGDLNVAPLEHDVWSHKQMTRIVSHTPIECEKLIGVQQSGSWVDARRLRVPEPTKLYTWWSYRSLDWKAADKGRRLDHIWVAPALADRVIGMRVLKHWRGSSRPSDHVPVTATLEV
jgi:exodeoxyribonuclease-3